MSINITFNEREQHFIRFIFVEVFSGGSTRPIQKILGTHIDAAIDLEAKLSSQSKQGLASISLTAKEWRVVYESINAVIYGLGPHELQTCTGKSLQEACNINLKICVAVWGAYGGMGWPTSNGNRKD